MEPFYIVPAPTGLQEEQPMTDKEILEAKIEQKVQALNDDLPTIAWITLLVGVLVLVMVLTCGAS